MVSQKLRFSQKYHQCLGDSWGNQKVPVMWSFFQNKGIMWSFTTWPYGSPPHHSPESNVFCAIAATQLPRFDFVFSYSAVWPIRSETKIFYNDLKVPIYARFCLGSCYLLLSCRNSQIKVNRIVSNRTRACGLPAERRSIELIKWMQQILLKHLNIRVFIPVMAPKMWPVKF